MWPRVLRASRLPLCCPFADEPVQKTRRVRTSRPGSQPLCPPPAVCVASARRVAVAAVALNRRHWQGQAEKRERAAGPINDAA